MALPKEPRQKMINFMYLVLTAMLALNVSSEILNAFKVVNGSLIKSNDVVDRSNTNVQTALAALMADPANKEKATEWKQRADQAIALTKSESQFIESLKDSLMRASGYNPEKGDTTFKEDDLNAPTRLFDTYGQGEILKNTLAKFKTNVLAVLPAGDQAAIASQIPIDLNPIKSNNTASEKDWTTGYFHMTPTIAALTILSKFQNDVKRSGNIVAEHCLQQVGKVEFHLDKFQAFAGQNSQYLLPGQPFELTAGLGAFSSANLPTVSVNGSSVPVDANGVATYKETAGGGGDRNLSVVISYKNPNTGIIEKTTKEIKYTVGQASGASIFLTKMNVMYIGVDNPITVSGGSGKAETMQVSFSGGSVTGTGSSRICRTQSSPGNATINVSIEGKSTSFPIRVKFLPDPVPLIGSAKHGPMAAASFRAMGGVRAELEGSDFEAPFTILGYTVGGSVNGQYLEVAVNGAQWGGNAVISAAKPNSVVSIFHIRAKGPDGRERTLNDLTFKLQ